MISTLTGLIFFTYYYYPRTEDTNLIATYRVQAELSAIASTEDGRAVVLGTSDGCLSVLAIADPNQPHVTEYLASLPSRDEQVNNSDK